MNIINLQGIGDISDRRLIERLSGWRLWTFLGLFFANLFAIVVPSVFQQQLSPTLGDVSGLLLLSQTAVLALLIGAFRFPLSVKFAACCAGIFGFTWVAVQNPLSKAAQAEAVFSLSLQSTILVLASTIFWWRRTAAPFRFQIRDLLVTVTTIAIVLPSMRSVFNEGFILEPSISPSSLAKRLPFPILNAGWCLLVLCCYIRGIIPEGIQNLFAKQSTEIKHLKINRTLLLVVLAIVLAIGDFTVYRLLNYRSPGTNFLIQRIVYLGWLFLSMVPVVGLEVKPRRLDA